MRYALIAIFVLGACVPTEEKPIKQTSQENACGAAALQHLLGTPFRDDDFASTKGPLRVLPPNSAVTMDHRPDRLNVHMDEDDVIVRIACG